ncbi:MAG: MFS transporter [Thaumarchaeota archaeon]|nr:MFS transporter [Nitrososphaerota archaeon]
MSKNIRSPFILLSSVASIALLSYTMARSPLLPIFSKSLGASPELLGLIAGASTVTGIFVKLPSGALSDIYGRRRLLLIGLLFFAFVPFGYLLVTNPLQLLAIRFVHGFATAIFGPVASATVSQLYNEKRGEKLGWYSAADNIGRTIGPFLGGTILFLNMNNFYLAYAIAGVIGVAALLVGTNISIPEEKRDVSVNPWKKFSSGIREVASSRPIVLASAMESAQYLAVGALTTFLPIYALGVGLNAGEIGLLFLAQGIVMLAAKPFAGMVSDKIGRRAVIVFGLVLGALTLIVIPITVGLVPLLALSAVFGLSVGTVTPSTTALVADLSKEARLGAAMGVFGTIWDIGEASGPIIAGILIATLASFFITFSIIAVIVLFLAVVFIIGVRDPKGKQVK